MRKSLSCPTLFGFLLFFLSSSLNSQPLQAETSNIYTDNAAAFTSKYEMLNKVKKNLDLSYFIVEDDYSSSLFFQKVIQKIEQGRANGSPIRVRLLVDYFMTDLQIPFLKFLDAYPEIEVKRFGAPTEQWKKVMSDLHIDGPLFVTSLMAQDSKGLKASLPPTLAGFKENIVADHFENGGKLDSQVWKMSLLAAAARIKQIAPPFYEGFLEFLKRTHHKLLLQDGVCFQMGGRNISDEYHSGPSDELIRGDETRGIKKRMYAFADLDVATCAKNVTYATSPLTKSFEKLWQDARNISLQKVYTTNEKTADIFTIEELNRKAELGKHLLDSKSAATTITAPEKGLDATYVENQNITETYISILNSLRKGDVITLVNAYFYQDSKWIDKKAEPLIRLNSALMKAAQNGADITLYTNSMATTDLSIVNVFSYPTYKELTAAGVKIKELQFFEGENSQGSLHMKGALVKTANGSSILVGSYNLDPRSHLKDTNNLLLIKIPRDQEVKVESEFLSAVTALKWVNIDGAKIAEIETKLAEPKNVKLRRNIWPFRPEI